MKGVWRLTLVLIRISKFGVCAVSCNGGTVLETVLSNRIWKAS